MRSTTNAACRCEAPLMVVDTSALVVILKVEPEAAELRLCLSQAATALISTATLLEAQMVVCSHLGDDVGLPELELPLVFKGNHCAHTDVTPAVSADEP